MYLPYNSLTHRRSVQPGSYWGANEARGGGEIDITDFGALEDEMTVGCQVSMQTAYYGKQKELNTIHPLHHATVSTEIRKRIKRHTCTQSSSQAQVLHTEFQENAADIDPIGRSLSKKSMHSWHNSSLQVTPVKFDLSLHLA
jgi:hypothetical protein